MKKGPRFVSQLQGKCLSSKTIVSISKSANEDHNNNNDYDN